MHSFGAHRNTAPVVIDVQNGAGSADRLASLLPRHTAMDILFNNAVMRVDACDRRRAGTRHRAAKREAVLR